MNEPMWVDGRLVEDPELKFTPKGNAVCNFRIATNDSRRNEHGDWENTNQLFLSANCWNGLAEAVANFRKGDAICVRGKLVTRVWENDAGEKRSRVELQVFRAYSPIQPVQQQAPQQQQSQQPQQGDPWGSQPQQQGQFGGAWAQPQPQSNGLTDPPF